MENKIPFYNIVNMLLTGLILIGILLVYYLTDILVLIKNRPLDNISIPMNSIIVFAFFAIIYEVGLIINRLGSLLEEILKSMRLIPFNNDYKLFNERKKEFTIMTVLSREYALSRTDLH